MKINRIEVDVEKLCPQLAQSDLAALDSQFFFWEYSPQHLRDLLEHAKVYVDEEEVWNEFGCFFDSREDFDVMLVEGELGNVTTASGSIIVFA